MICPNCKKPIPKDCNFCIYCGHRLKPEDQEFLEWKRPKESEFLIKTSTEEFATTKTRREEDNLKYAGFWSRVGAWFVDVAILVISFVLFVVLILGGNIFWSKNLDQLITFLAFILYHTLFLSVYSSTPGKMLYGLEVVDANTKEKIKFGKALLRSLSYIISSTIFSLGFFWVAIDKEKHQGWHDKIAKTLVIKKKEKPLILPIILSTLAICFIIWISYLTEQGYDFSYLGRESEVISSIQQRLSQQPAGFCCSFISPSELNNYLRDIPTKLYPQQKRSAEKIFEEFSRAVVLIGGETKDGDFAFGSGFVISPSGLIVTNFHVIKDMHKLVVALLAKNPQLFDVNLIVAKDEFKDIAILKIDGKNLPYVILGNSDLVKVGQKVFAIGNPEGYTNTISDGIISQIREFYPGIKSFQITNPISQGSSGGPLFNENGEVIGITYLMNLYGQNLNFAIPINYVKELIGLE